MTKAFDIRAFGEPGFWMNETTGVLAPVVTAYLNRATLTEDQVRIMKAYLAQWIGADVWMGPEIDELRRLAAAIDNEKAIDDWILKAIDSGLDPL